VKLEYFFCWLAIDGALNAGVEKAMEIKPTSSKWKFYIFCYCMYRLISKAFWKGEYGVNLYFSDFSNIYLWLVLDDVVDVDV
jgi:hypothetical protein